MADHILLTPQDCGQCTKMLAAARATLELEMGIVSHIHQDQYHVMAISADHNMIVPGEIFALKDTVCNAVFTSQQFVALTSYSSQDKLRLHPVYEQMKLEAYIAAPIWLNNEIWGTVNFTSTQIRTHAFTADEEALVTDCAAKVSALLEQRNH